MVLTPPDSCSEVIVEFYLSLLEQKMRTLSSLKKQRNKIISRLILVALLTGLLLIPFSVSQASPLSRQVVYPQIPSASTCVDFSTLAPGESVEGLGTVNPNLNISTSSGTAVSIATGLTPSAFGAPNDTLVKNNGVGDFAGFFDSARIHDYVFSFAPDVTIKYFSVTMLDFGDFNSIGATEHNVSLVALDSDNNVVSSDTLSFTSDGKVIPRSGSAGDLYFTGDAITAEPGQPGRYSFEIFDNNISRLEMKYSSNVNDFEATDPYFALAILCFEVEDFPEPPTGTVCADFAALEPGSPVEGLGTVHPSLNILTSTGNGVSIEEGVPPSAFGAPNASLVQNNGVGDLAGLFDASRVHDYSFEFAPNTYVDYFSLKMLDFGDFNQNGATEHNVTLVGYDENDAIVATHTLSFTSDGKVLPRSGSAGDLYYTGDAITANPGEPGNFTFGVSAARIDRLSLEFSSNVSEGVPTDPYFALAVLCFDPLNDVSELDPPTAELTLLRPKTSPEVGGKFLVEYACSETAPNLVSADINGYDVASGQEVNLVVRENESARIVDGTLIWLFAPEFSLNVTCADDLGNEVSTSVQPEFVLP